MAIDPKAVDMVRIERYLRAFQPFTGIIMWSALEEQGFEVDAADCLNVLKSFGDRIHWSSKGGYVFDPEG